MPKNIFYHELGFAKVDHHRQKRRGFPEVIYCPGKTFSQIEKISQEIISRSQTLFLTKAEPPIYDRLKEKINGLSYNPQAKIIYLNKTKRPDAKKGLVLIISAGTSDIPVAEEAAITLEVTGNKIKKLYDVGVAGIHRLFNHQKLLKKAKVIIVVAGMEGALASVVSGITSCPVVAVPTSVGYGASFKGIAPLLTMLNSCSPGIAVVNIDNGFGAGYFANLINK
jgi:NCAIR mutase (PurE)-related protein